MTKRSLPDVNVRVAPHNSDHLHHERAAAWWNGESSLIGFSRLRQLGLLRLLTTRAAMGGKPLSNRQAWSVYDSFVGDDRVGMFPELPTVEEAFRSFSGTRTPALKMWVDAYLAAYASRLEATLITFDRAFSQYDCSSRILASAT